MHLPHPWGFWKGNLVGQCWSKPEIVHVANRYISVIKEKQESSGTMVSTVNASLKMSCIPWILHVEIIRIKTADNRQVCLSGILALA
jgi:hypothetical protein